MDRETAMGVFALSKQDPALVREAWAWRVGVFCFSVAQKKPERHALRLEEFGLQFAVQNGIDDNVADGVVVLHRSGEDIGGFDAGLGREEIYEVRSAI